MILCRINVNDHVFNRYLIIKFIYNTFSLLSKCCLVLAELAELELAVIGPGSNPGYAPPFSHKCIVSTNDTYINI